MQPEKHILRSDVVVSAIGRWPSFHDSEVLTFTLERASPTGSAPPTAAMEVLWRAYAPRNEGTPRYELALVRSVVISFRFTDVSDVNVSDFNQQNVIESLEVSRVDDANFDGFLVTVDPIFGFGGSWRCKAAAVADVRSLFPPQV